MPSRIRDARNRDGLRQAHGVPLLESVSLVPYASDHASHLLSPGDKTVDRDYISSSLRDTLSQVSDDVGLRYRLVAELNVDVTD